MMLLAEVVFWVCALAVLGTYLIYPVSVVVLSRLRRRRAVDSSGAPLPTVTLIISAFNEAGVIRSKIENALASSYPRDRLEIMVISDGSDDGTDEIVAEYADRGVVLRRQDPRGGKSRGLTTFVPEARGEVLVFSDANSMYDSAAIERLAAHFVDPAIGYVVGHQRYVEAGESAVASSEGLYWRYEILLKTCESRLSSVVGGDGAIYATRASLFRPLRDDDISDFVNPLQIIAQGHRGVFDETAFCYEEVAASFTGEFRRKIRIVNRALRGASRVGGVLNPFRVGWFAYQLLFHKVLRWFAPYFLIGVLVSSVALAIGTEQPIYLLAVLAQAVFYAVAALRFVPALGEMRLVYIPYYFCVVNVAALLGTLSVIAGARFTTWQPQR